MKSLLSLFVIFGIGQQALAFNNLVGNYRITGTPTVVKQNADYCNRFAFEDLKNIEVTASVGPKNQTHAVIFYSLLNNSPVRFNHPIMEYHDQTPEGFLSYATTTQAPDSVQNEWGNSSPDGVNRGLIVGFVRLSDSQYVAYIHEFKKVNNSLEAGCYYNVDIEAI